MHSTPTDINVRFSNDMGHAMFYDSRDINIKLPETVRDYCYKVLLPKYIINYAQQCGNTRISLHRLRDGLNKEWTYQMNDNNTIYNIHMNWEC